MLSEWVSIISSIEFAQFRGAIPSPTEAQNQEVASRRGHGLPKLSRSGPLKCLQLKGKKKR